MEMDERPSAIQLGSRGRDCAGASLFPVWDRGGVASGRVPGDCCGAEPVTLCDSTQILWSRLCRGVSLSRKGMWGRCVRTRAWISAVGLWS